MKKEYNNIDVQVVRFDTTEVIVASDLEPPIFEEITGGGDDGQI